LKDFNYYIESEQVKKQSSSPAEARSLRVQARERFKHRVEDENVTKDNSTFLFEDAYEALRQHLKSFMAEDGYKPYSHEALIAYSEEKNYLTESEANKLDKYRKIRNDIRYRGETAQKDRAIEIIKLAEKILFE